jgi:hypothetical protein
MPVVFSSRSIAAPSSGSGPAAPTNLLVTNQGGPNNASFVTLTNHIELGWTAAAAGSFPIATYNIYRGVVNGAARALYATGVTGTTYTDSAATNANQYQFYDQATPYTYAVSAVDIHGTEGPLQTQCGLWGYLNGASNWGNADLSYTTGPSPNYADTTGAPPIGTEDILFQFQGGGGGWQPYASYPQVPIYDLEIGWAKYIVFDVKRSTVPNPYTFSMITRLPQGDVYPNKNVNPDSYVTGLTSGVWTNYKIPLVDCNVGINTFVGSVAPNASTSSFNDLPAYGGAAHTWNCATLTVTSTTSGGVGVELGGFITGSGIPAGTFVLSGSAGTYVLCGQNVPSGGFTLASSTLTYSRTCMYKSDFYAGAGSAAESVWFNNLGYTT